MADEGTTEEAVTVTEDSEPQEQPTQPDDLPKDHPLVKTLAAQKAQIKELRSKAARLDELEKAQLSTEERLTQERDTAVAERDQALAELLRWKVATRFGLADEDVDLFLTGTDEDTLTKQAERLAERTPPVNGGLRVPAEGRNPSVPALNSDDLEGALKRKLGINT